MPRRIVRAGTGRMSGARGGIRRQTEWIAGVSPWQPRGSATTVDVVGFSQADLADLVPFTITRTVGIAAIAFDEDFILDQDIFCAWGGVVVKERARVAGTGSMPRPIVNIGDDGWFWHQPVCEFIESDFTGRSGLAVTIDSRAQRKVEDGDAIAFLLEIDGTSDAIEQAMMVRILCKLH